MHRLTRQEAIEFVSRHRELFDSHENPFAHSEWQIHFLRQVAQDDWAIRIAEHSTADDCHAAMLLHEAPGVSCQALSNYYCSLYSPVISAPHAQPHGVAEVVHMMTRAGRPPTVRFAPLDAREADTLGVALRARGWFVKRFFCFGNWYLPCDGLGYDAYLASRDSKMRNTLLRKSKKFFADAAHRLEVITEPAEVERGMDAYDRVFARSWKQPEPYPDFIRGWARICAQLGWLRLGIAWVGDVPVAVQFWFVHQRKAHIFKLAYDEDHARLSAGTVLTAHLFRHALEHDRVAEIDYLTGDDPYKRDWMSMRRERVGLLACDLRSLRGLGHAMREAAGTLRRRCIEFARRRRAPHGPALAFGGPAGLIDAGRAADS